MRILFVCYANACRSQMAEAYASARAPEGEEIFSAGVMAAGIFDRVRKVMARWGLDMRGQRSKTLAEVADRPFDLVITLSDRARRSAQKVQALERLHWPVLDPAGVRGSEEELDEVFQLTAEDIAEHIDELFEQRFDLSKLGPKPAGGSHD